MILRRMQEESGERSRSKSMRWMSGMKRLRRWRSCSVKGIRSRSSIRIHAWDLALKSWSPFTAILILKMKAWNLMLNIKSLWNNPRTRSSWRGYQNSWSISGSQVPSPTNRLKFSSSRRHNLSSNYTSKPFPSGSKTKSCKPISSRRSKS